MMIIIVSPQGKIWINCLRINDKSLNSVERKRERERERKRERDRERERERERERNLNNLNLYVTQK